MGKGDISRFFVVPFSLSFVSFYFVPQICKDIGTKISLSKGEAIGQCNELGHAFYRLVQGQVVMKSDGIDIVHTAPSSLMIANVLIGHGRQTNDFFAKKYCVLYEIDVQRFRYHLLSHPVLALKFWQYMSNKLAHESRVS